MSIVVKKTVLPNCEQPVSPEQHMLSSLLFLLKSIGCFCQLVCTSAEELVQKDSHDVNSSISRGIDLFHSLVAEDWYTWWILGKNLQYLHGCSQLQANRYTSTLEKTKYPLSKLLKNSPHSVSETSNQVTNYCSAPKILETTGVGICNTSLRTF